jgi:hypothetical protein
LASFETESFYLNDNTVVSTTFETEPRFGTLEIYEIILTGLDSICHVPCSIGHIMLFFIKVFLKSFFQSIHIQIHICCKFLIN